MAASAAAARTLCSAATLPSVPSPPAAGAPPGAALPATAAASVPGMPGILPLGFSPGDSTGSCVRVCGWKT
jgi:hypothetical protein